MDKKNLAKAAMLAIVLAAGTVGAEESTKVTEQTATHLIIQPRIQAAEAMELKEIATQL